MLKWLSLVLSAVFLVSCVSAIPPARIGEYVSSKHLAGDGAFTTIDQRPLQAGLVLVSDTGDPGTAPNLPEEALARLGESLQRDLSRIIPVAINERSQPAISRRSRMGIGPSSWNWADNAG